VPVTTTFGLLAVLTCLSVACFLLPYWMGRYHKVE
jgi:hypothetical protein